jgi:hypothetical protein
MGSNLAKKLTQLASQPASRPNLKNPVEIRDDGVPHFFEFYMLNNFFLSYIVLQAFSNKSQCLVSIDPHSQWT